MKRPLSPSKQYAIDLYKSSKNHLANLISITKNPLPDDVNKSVVYVKYILLLVQKEKPINTLMVHKNPNANEGISKSAILFNLTVLQLDSCPSKLLVTDHITGKKQIQDYLNKLLKYLCC